MVIGRITSVDLDSLPELQPPAGSPTSQTLAVEELLREERVYVARWERLAKFREEIGKAHGIVLAGDMEAADNLLLKSRDLINAQRRFLLRLETLTLRPNRHFDSDWVRLFRDWAERAKKPYALFIYGEKDAKRALLAAIALKEALSPSSSELREVIGDVIAVLSMPYQRLEKYNAFLEVGTL